MDKSIIITIDGPSGVGKSTAAKSVAEKLGLSYLDTGAMYRSIALQAKTENVDINNDEELKSLLNHTYITRGGKIDHKILLLVNDKDVSDKIRTPEITALSSDIATKPIVREKMVQIQREIGQGGGIVAEGRDMGTYVFPEADFKFYLDADTEIRAERRWSQQKESGNSEDLDIIERKIKSRDKQDMERSESPLHPARNAVIINTTHLKADEVVFKIIKAVQDL